MKQKTAFVIGITGQDGSYLTEFLLAKNYQVVGLMRKTSAVPSSHVAHLANKIHIAYGDLLDTFSIAENIRSYHAGRSAGRGIQSRGSVVPRRIVAACHRDSGDHGHWRSSCL